MPLFEDELSGAKLSVCNKDQKEMAASRRLKSALYDVVAGWGIHIMAKNQYNRLKSLCRRHEVVYWIFLYIESLVVFNAIIISNYGDKLP